MGMGMMESGEVECQQQALVVHFLEWSLLTL